MNKLEHTITIDNFTAKVFSTVNSKGDTLHGVQYTLAFINYTTPIEFKHQTLEEAIKVAENRLQFAMLSHGI